MHLLVLRLQVLLAPQPLWPVGWASRNLRRLWGPRLRRGPVPHTVPEDLLPVRVRCRTRSGAGPRSGTVGAWRQPAWRAAGLRLARGVRLEVAQRHGHAALAAVECHVAGRRLLVDVQRHARVSRAEVLELAALHHANAGANGDGTPSCSALHGCGRHVTHLAHACPWPPAAQRPPRPGGRAHPPRPACQRSSQLLNTSPSRHVGGGGGAAPPGAQRCRRIARGGRPRQPRRPQCRRPPAGRAGRRPLGPGHPRQALRRGGCLAQAEDVVVGLRLLVLLAGHHGLAGGGAGVNLSGLVAQLPGPGLSPQAAPGRRRGGPQWHRQPCRHVGPGTRREHLQ
mmetsp:Transcript_92515/g.287964  ORF Transcript_92515/g.287964 Transcript_92515/m.287964 type:complete len:339 (-) Transcript_92515:256-1272(-)